MNILKKMVAPLAAAASLFAVVPMAQAATLDLGALGLTEGDSVLSNAAGTVDVVAAGPASFVAIQTTFFASPSLTINGSTPFGDTDFQLTFSDVFGGASGLLGQSTAVAADADSIEILFDVASSSSALTSSPQLLVSIAGSFATDVSGNPFLAFALEQAALISITEVGLLSTDPVPLPAGLPLMATGLAVAGFVRKRRAQKMA